MSFKAMNHKETQDWQQTKIPRSGYQWDLNTHCSQRDLNSAISDHFSKLSQYKAIWTAAYFTSFLCAWYQTMVITAGCPEQVGMWEESNPRLLVMSWILKPLDHLYVWATTTNSFIFLFNSNQFFHPILFFKFESNCGDCIWVSRYESRMKNKIAILCSSWTAQWLLSRWLLCDVTILSYFLSLRSGGLLDF